MVQPESSASPFDDVREAFSGLRTSEKAAFVFEATFNTLGQALSETGRRVATTIDDLDIDSWFLPPHRPAPPAASAPPPPPPPTPPPSTPRPPEPMAPPSEE